MGVRWLVEQRQEKRGVDDDDRQRADRRVEPEANLLGDDDGEGRKMSKREHRVFVVLERGEKATHCRREDRRAQEWQKNLSERLDMRRAEIERCLDLPLV